MQFNIIASKILSLTIMKNKVNSINLAEYNITLSGFKILTKTIGSLKKQNFLECFVAQDLNSDYLNLLFESLKTNKSLKELYLKYPKFNDNSAKKLAESLSTNNTVKNLNIYSPNIGNNQLIEISKGLKQNKSLEKLNFNSINIINYKSYVKIILCTKR